MPATAQKQPSRARGIEAWSKAFRDLADLPYKVETNARGQLILSPPKPEYSFPQFGMARLIHEALGASVATEFAVQTSDGVKVPDVIWISDECRAEIPEGAEASPVMPELCVEVMSDLNTEAEMQEKGRLYFEGGATEVWIVSREGKVRFYESPREAREQSALAPGFPQEVQA